MAPIARPKFGRDTRFVSMGLSTPADFEGDAGPGGLCTGKPAERDGSSPVAVGPDQPNAPASWLDSPDFVTVRGRRKTDDTVEGRDVLLELMAEELARLKGQIAELRGLERPEQGPEGPERGPEQSFPDGRGAAEAGARPQPSPGSPGVPMASAPSTAEARATGVAHARAPGPGLAERGGAAAAPAGSARRPTLPTLKLGTYDLSPHTQIYSI